MPSKLSMKFTSTSQRCQELFFGRDKSLSPSLNARDGLLDCKQGRISGRMKSHLSAVLSSTCKRLLAYFNARMSGAAQSAGGRFVSALEYD